MKTFLKRLKTLFRPARKPFDKAAFEQRYEAAAAGHKAKMQALDAKLAIISTRLSADHQSASDAVSAAWVREEIAKGNAAALNASRTMTRAKADRTFTVTLDADGFVSTMLIDGGGKPPVKVERVGGMSIVSCEPGKSSEAFAEIIRAADALYRLAGVK